MAAKKNALMLLERPLCLLQKITNICNALRLQEAKNDNCNGARAGLEAAAATYDDNDVSVSVARGGVVYDVKRPYNAAVSAGECCHWRYDRRFRSMVGA
jgi:hypothetical protein